MIRKQKAIFGRNSVHGASFCKYYVIEIAITLFRKMTTFMPTLLTDYIVRISDDKVVSFSTSR